MTIETTAPEAQSAPQAAPGDAKAAPAADAKAKKVPSLREAVESAANEVASQERRISETESAARVLRGESEYPDAKPDAKPAPKPDAKAAAKPETKPAEKPKADAKPADADVKGAERDESGRVKSSDAKAPEQSGTAPGEAENAQSGQKPAENAPPPRFSREAQAEWDKTPETVRSEVQRFVSETEKGLETHQARSHKYAEIEPFEALGQQYGMSVKGVLEDYAGMARMMAQNPRQVFETLAQRHGVSLEDMASEILDEPMSEFAERATKTISALQQEVNRLQRENATFKTQQTDNVMKSVSEFADKHPRFEELAPTIKWILSTNGVDKSDITKALPEAYAMAERLRPAPGMPQTPAAQAAPAAPAQPDFSAQTAVAQKSVTGGPVNGSNPRKTTPAVSTHEAVREAFRRTGGV